ncbi:ABC transporter permease [Haloactinopolyspora sp.]|uniref:ABC transporter permease n=1 Tax=Haloactinopolyspora sp. TaxID=1966353 RepID=UPI002623338B|nr:ABC transporter permease [Haloactinopolyspora sp.]
MTTVRADPAQPEQGTNTRRPLWRRVFVRPETGSLVGAVAVFVFFFAVATPFRQLDSFATVLYSAAVLGIMAVAVGLLMIGGEFDLSAGVAVTTSAITAAILSYQLTLNVWVGVFFALVVSLAVGFFNGYVVIKTGIPSFLVTLGTFLMLQGANLAVTRLVTGTVSTQRISDMDGYASLEAIFASEWTVGGVRIRVLVLWWLLFVAIATWVLLRTRVGNWIFAVGGNKDSARAVGVPVARVKIGLYMTVGFAAWFVGMHLLFSLHTVQAGEGVGNEFEYIIAAVIGGCLLTGGYGSAVGAGLGAFIFGMAKQGIVFAGWNPDWYWTFLGAMLLLATLMNMYVRRLAAKR